MTLVQDDPELGESIKKWRSYIKCAVQHPTLPRGPHIKVTDVSTIIKAPDLQRCYGLLYQLYTTVNESQPFRELPDALETGALNYYEVVKQPMCLRDVLDSIVNNSRYSVTQCLSDVDLIWKNCVTYNGPGNALTSKANVCAEWWKRALAESQDSVVASLERVEPLLLRINQLQSDELLEQIQSLVLKEDPALIVNGEIIFDGIRVGLLAKIEALTEAFGRPKSARSGRATPMTRQ